MTPALEFSFNSGRAQIMRTEEKTMTDRTPGWILRDIGKRKRNGRRIVFLLMLAAALGAALSGPALSQPRPPMTEAEKAKRWELANELAALAVIERKLMVPKRAGRRVAT